MPHISSLSETCQSTSVAACWIAHGKITFHDLIFQVYLNQNEIFREHKWFEAKVLQLGSDTFVTSKTREEKNSHRI